MDLDRAFIKRGSEICTSETLPVKVIAVKIYQQSLLVRQAG